MIVAQVKWFLGKVGIFMLENQWFLMLIPETDTSFEIEISFQIESYKAQRWHDNARVFIWRKGKGRAHIGKGELSDLSCYEDSRWQTMPWSIRLSTI